MSFKEFINEGYDVVRRNDIPTIIGFNFKEVDLTSVKSLRDAFSNCNVETYNMDTEFYDYYQVEPLFDVLKHGELVEVKLTESETNDYISKQKRT